MKLSLANIFIFAAFCVFQVKGQYDVLKVNLNWGKSHYCVDRWDNCCTSWEWNFIQTQFYVMSGKQRRGLRGNETSTPPMNITDTAERQLQTWPRECANPCAGVLPGRCLAAKCKGYRRTLVDSIMSIAQLNDRNLYWATNCENQKSEVNNLLNNIKWQVGPRCRSLIDAPREMTCKYNVWC
jgi:hypothetical protein